MFSILKMCMRYTSQNNPLVFITVQVSSEVTDGETTRTLHTEEPHIRMPHAKSRTVLYFSGGVRSCGVTGGGMVKTS